MAIIPDDTSLATEKQAPKITVEIQPGRWGKIFHLFDRDGREIALHLKDATSMARQILKESKR